MKKVIKRIKTSDIFRDRKRQVINSLVQREIQKNYDYGYRRIAGLSFDMILSSININGLYEKDYLEILMKWLIQNELVNGCAVDVGANIGNHSVFFSKYYREVYSFEPNPVVFKVLKLNSEIAAERDNIFCYPYGISDASNVVNLHTPNNTHISSSRIVNSNDVGKGDAIEIELKKLDDFEEIEKEEIGLIKIDVEGHEIQVFHGARKLIQKNFPVVLFEQHTNEFQNNTSPSVDFLKELDYKFYLAKYRPDRGVHLSAFARSVNFLRSILSGSEITITEVSEFPKANYNFIIAVHQSKIANL